MQVARIGRFELIALPTRFLVRRGLWVESGPAHSIHHARRAAIGALRAHLDARDEERIGRTRVEELRRALAELERSTSEAALEPAQAQARFSMPRAHREPCVWCWLGYMVVDSRAGLVARLNDEGRSRHLEARAALETRADACASAAALALAALTRPTLVVFVVPDVELAEMLRDPKLPGTSEAVRERHLAAARGHRVVATWKPLCAEFATTLRECAARAEAVARGRRGRVRGQ
jgi:hypothetical protein